MLFRYLTWILLIGLIQPAAAQEIVVSPEGPVRSLQQAIAMADSGDVIRVEAGLYQDTTIVVDRSVTLIGEGEPVLDGNDTYQIMTVTAEHVRISGFVFRNVGTSFVEDRAAVKVDEGHHCVIENNRFEDTFFGIYLAKTADCRVERNTIRGPAKKESQSGNGIHLWYSKDVTITHNYVAGHRDGIYMEFVEDSEVSDNISEHNMRYGLHFMFSDRCAYRNNTLRKNGAGVAVMYTEDVEMRGNRFEDNWGSAAFGLLLKDITDSTIEDNIFVRNTVALYAEGSNRTQVRGNQFRSNGWAVKIMANSIDNVFTGNNFLGNSFDVSTNSRHHYSTFEGNYWDNYQGYDIDRDGIGDVPFRPVRLFSFMVEQNEPALLLMRSFFVSLLDAAERVLPVLTPEALIDQKPLMQRVP